MGVQLGVAVEARIPYGGSKLRTNIKGHRILMNHCFGKLYPLYIILLTRVMEIG